MPAVCRWLVRPDEDMMIEDNWERRGTYAEEE